MVVEDPFWDIQLGVLNDPITQLLIDENPRPQISWSAPIERECIGKLESRIECYEDFSLSIPMGLDRKPIQLALTALRPSRNILGYVGEEIWDAAFIFSAYLISLDLNVVKSMQGKRLLELGSGCGLVGMVAALLGPAKVILTDHTETVLNNLHSNVEQNRRSILEMNPDCTIYCADLDWARYLRSDIRKVNWIHEQQSIDKGTTTAHGYVTQSINDESNEVKDHLSNIDLIIGSALVYSVDGAFMLADTIHHFFEQRHLTKVLILQMTTRPGYDRFILRLLSFGYSLKFLEIAEHVIKFASVIGRRDIPSQESFKLLEITNGDEGLQRNHNDLASNMN